MSASVGWHASARSERDGIQQPCCILWLDLFFCRTNKDVRQWQRNIVRVESISIPELLCERVRCLHPSCDPWRRYYSERPERTGVSVVHRHMRLDLLRARDAHLHERRLERVESIPELLCERVPALPDLVVSGNRGDLPIKCALMEYGRRECHSFVCRPGKPVLRAGPDNRLGA